jgi:histidine ammonia-lyase
MAANGATRIMKICDNVKSLLSIELLCAMQAMDFRKIDNASKFTRDYYSRFRKTIAFIAEDRIVHDDIVKARDFIK